MQHTIPPELEEKPLFVELMEGFLCFPVPATLCLGCERKKSTPTISPFQREREEREDAPSVDSDEV